MDSSSQQVDLRQGLDNWVAKTPVVCRTLTISSIVGFCLGTIMIGSAGLATIPFFVLHRLEVYRLVISPLFESHALAVLIVLMWLNRTGVKLETELGSRRFAAILLQVSVAINFVFCAMIVVLSQAAGAPYLMVLGCQGFFPTILALFVILPPRGPVHIAFIPGAIPPKFVPFAIVALSAILSGAIPFDLLCAIAVGFLMKRVFTELWTGGPVLPMSQYHPVNVQPDTAAVADSSNEKNPVSRSVVLSAIESRLEKQQQHQTPPQPQQDDR